MASIYFHYNELLRLSAKQAVMNEDQQQPKKQTEKKPEMRVNHGVSKVPFSNEATLVALQPRMNRLAYLQAATGTNLDALARSLGPRL
ncbi:hypothetical protein GN244_ATG12512 [Phytophthora infestans]|uniref:Uncharacterized protein n=1 Tax=Phytophthora infestans TaxID=4787 RepID=A0A833T1T0_PHYIN|nr:hypothetical protein GN244_ATG12512 [Phytophthora infestans]KAF4145548.1 hypothetical protein GN958_ATG05257 [Phytophthora infestans]